MKSLAEDWSVWVRLVLQNIGESGMNRLAKLAEDWNGMCGYEQSLGNLEHLGVNFIAENRFFFSGHDLSCENCLLQARFVL